MLKFEEGKRGQKFVGGFWDLSVGVERQTFKDLSREAHILRSIGGKMGPTKK